MTTYKKGLIAKHCRTDTESHAGSAIEEFIPLPLQFKAGLHENLPLQLAQSQQRATQMSFRWSKKESKAWFAVK
jgi:hypothetical protein